MRCDFCKQWMESDETGLFCMRHEMGGHLSCAYNHFKKEHDDE